MTLQNENPGGESGASKSCECGGSCKQVNSATNPRKSQVKLPLDTRHDLAELRDYLMQEGNDNLTARSAISACDFLLRNF